MRPEHLLVVLCSRSDATVSVHKDRLRVEAPHGVLTPVIRDALATHKTDLLRLLALAEKYRVLLRDGAPDEMAFRDAQTRLIDELGPGLATVMRQAVERKEASSIPRC